MTKDHARQILDRLREGHPMPVALTTKALLITGDISRISHPTLCFDSNESTDDRDCETQNQGTKEVFSYSAYLDSQQNQGVKE